ncbi:MAG: YigZ family protein [Sphingobacteriaceae bacterium]
MFNDTYLTVKKTSQGLFKDKGSKFIGYIFPIQSAEEVKEIVAELKAEHPKARHICWALRVSTDRSVFRVNDDGEPSGTAGKPILNTLLSADLTQVCVAVVRYFGGTLLGVPGLIHAYKQASVEAIKAAEIIEKTIQDCYQIEVPYAQLNEVMKILKEGKISIKSQKLDSDCILIIEIRQQFVLKIITQLENINNLRLNYLFSL